MINSPQPSFRPHMRAAICLALLAVLSTGCGNKGPLYLPKSKPEAQKPAQKPAAPQPQPDAVGP